MHPDVAEDLKTRPVPLAKSEPTITVQGPTPPRTERGLIRTIVLSIILLTTIYVLVMGYSVYQALPKLGEEAPDFPGRILDAFVHVGDILVGALIGLLVNTRSAPKSE